MSELAIAGACCGLLCETRFRGGSGEATGGFAFVPLAFLSTIECSSGCCEFSSCLETGVKYDLNAFIMKVADRPWQAP